MRLLHAVAFSKKKKRQDINISTKILRYVIPNPFQNILQMHFDFQDLFFMYVHIRMQKNQTNSFLFGNITMQNIWTEFKLIGDCRLFTD